MLTPELRTMSIKEIIELWETDKKKLKLKLLDDYYDLAKEYRKQIKIYNQESTKESRLWNEYRTCTLINYHAELGIDEPIRGTVKFTKDFIENIKIGLKIKDEMLCAVRSVKAYNLAETIRLKAREIEDTLHLLHVKVPYTKDFEKQNNWLQDDLFELRMQEIEEAKRQEEEIKERAKYIIEEMEEGEI